MAVGCEGAVWLWGVAVGCGDGVWLWGVAVGCGCGAVREPQVVVAARKRRAFGAEDSLVSGGCGCGVGLWGCGGGGSSLCFA